MKATGLNPFSLKRPDPDFFCQTTLKAKDLDPFNPKTSRPCFFAPDNDDVTCDKDIHTNIGTDAIRKHVGR
jgi:DNA phosphorothioation-dependent restriction protein DptG